MANIVFFPLGGKAIPELYLLPQLHSALKCKTGSQGPSSVPSLHLPCSDVFCLPSEVVSILQSPGLNTSNISTSLSCLFFFPFVA